MLAGAVIRGEDAYVWDVSSGNLVQTTSFSTPGGADDLRDIALTPDGSELLISAANLSTINAFLLADSSLAHSYATGPDTLAVAITADGGFVAGGADAPSGKDIFVFESDETPVRSWDVGGSTNLVSDRGLAFSADNTRLFAVTHSAHGRSHLSNNVIADDGADDDERFPGALEVESEIRKLGNALSAPERRERNRLLLRKARWRHQDPRRHEDSERVRKRLADRQALRQDDVHGRVRGR
jgi:hypothetical protein